MSVAPRDFSSAIAEFIEPPVASIGSRTIAVRALKPPARRSTYGSGSSVAWLRAMPTTLTLAFGIVSSTPSSMPSPARRIGTTVTFLPLICSTSVGPLQHCTVVFSSGKSAVASYASNRASSFVSSRNFLVEISSSRSSPTLCLTSGCLTSITGMRCSLRAMVRLQI